MYDDPKKELEALTAQIDAQEDWFQRELDAAKRMIGQQPDAPAAPVRNYANNYGTAPVRKSAMPPEDPGILEDLPKKKSNRGLVTLILIELLGILGIAGYWLLVLL